MKCQASLMVSDSFLKLRLFVWMIFKSQWAEAGLPSTHCPHPHPRDPKPLPCQPACLGLRQFFLVGTEDYQSESASERNNGWVIFRAPCFSSKHYRHKQWSGQRLHCCSGSNKSVLYFLFCAGWRGAREGGEDWLWKNIFWFLSLFLKKNDLLKERWHTVWWLFSLCWWL